MDKNSRYTVPEAINRLEPYTEVKYKPIHPVKMKAQKEVSTLFDLLFPMPNYEMLEISGNASRGLSIALSPETNS